MRTKDDNFSDMPTGGGGVWFAVAFLGYMIAAVTTFMFGYRFLRLFGMTTTINGMSVDGILSGLLCMFLVDGMLNAMGYLQLNHADTTAQMNIARVAYGLLLAVTCLMSFLFMGAAITKYRVGEISASDVELGQWIIVSIGVIDLLIIAAYHRTGSAFSERLQAAKHAAAMAHTLSQETGRIQKQGRENAQARLSQHGDAIANSIADNAVNGHIGRITPSRARLVPASPTPTDAPVQNGEIEAF